MGDSVTKVGQATISPQWQISIVKSVRPWLKGAKPGDIVEFHVEQNEVIMRKQDAEATE